MFLATVLLSVHKAQDLQIEILSARTSTEFSILCQLCLRQQRGFFCTSVFMTTEHNKRFLWPESESWKGALKGRKRCRAWQNTHVSPASVGQHEVILLWKSCSKPECNALSVDNFLNQSESYLHIHIVPVQFCFASVIIKQLNFYI